MRVTCCSRSRCIAIYEILHRFYFFFPHLRSFFFLLFVAPSPNGFDLLPRGLDMDITGPANVWQGIWPRENSEWIPGKVALLLCLVSDFRDGDRVSLLPCLVSDFRDGGKVALLPCLVSDFRDGDLFNIVRSGSELHPASEHALPTESAAATSWSRSGGSLGLRICLWYFCRRSSRSLATILRRLSLSICSSTLFFMTLSQADK